MAKIHHLCWKMDYFGIATSSFVAVYLLERDLFYSDSNIFISICVFAIGLMALMVKTKQLQLILLPAMFAWVAILAICRPILVHHPYPFWIGIGSMLFGGFFYTTHFPECFKPGEFDIIGASHSWWHLCTSVQMGATYYICWVLSIDKQTRPEVFAFYMGTRNSY